MPTPLRVLSLPLLALLVAAGCGDGDAGAGGDAGDGDDAGVGDDRWLLRLAGADDEFISRLLWLDDRLLVIGTSASFSDESGYEDQWVTALEPAPAGPPAVAWSRVISGSPWHDSGRAAFVADGRLMIVGNFQTSPPGVGDGFAIGMAALDAASGGLIGYRGYPSGGRETAVSLAADAAGGALVVGSAELEAGAALVHRVAGDGAWDWGAVAATEAYSSFDAVVPRGDGGLMVGEIADAGAGGGDLWLVEIDGAGGVGRQRALGGAENDWIFAATATADGGAALVGRTLSFGAADEDAWLVRLTADGDLAWDARLSGPGPQQGLAVVELADGDLVVAGVTGELTEFAEGSFVARVAGDGGAIRWQHRLTTAAGAGRARAVVAAPGGGVIVGLSAAFEAEDPNRLDALVLALAPDGGAPDGCVGLVDGDLVLAAGGATEMATAVEFTERPSSTDPFEVTTAEVEPMTASDCVATARAAP